MLIRHILSQQHRIPYPYRCPTTLVYPIPRNGISPISLVTTPGSCVDPGTDMEFSFTITEVLCNNQVNQYNNVSDCRLNLYFAIETQNVVSCPLCPTRTSPYLITGDQSFSYNLEGTFLFNNPLQKKKKQTERLIASDELDPCG